MSNWFTKLIGSTSGNVAEVDSSNNLKVIMPVGSASPANVCLSNDSGSDFLEFGSDGRAKVSMEQLLLFDPFDGANINTNLWNQSLTTMTLSQSSGLLTLNSGNSVAAGAFAIIYSIKMPLRLVEYPIYGQWKFKMNWFANAVIEFGFGQPSGATATIPDGAFVRIDATGVVRAVFSFASTEFSTQIAAAGTLVNGRGYSLEITMVEDSIKIDIADMTSGGDVVSAVVQIPSGFVEYPAVTHLPAFTRLYNSTAPGTAPQVSLGCVNVQQMDLLGGKTWGEQIVQFGRGAYQSPVTAFGQTSNHTNSANPGNATLLNTAAGYTTLGGRYQFAAPAGGITDYALFGFQVPAGFQLVVTGVRISAINTGAAVATTATILDWALGLNSSAVSLGTADGSGTWAPRRIPIGTQGFIVGNAIGVAAQDINATFPTPLVVDGGRFFHVIVQVPVGTATASQVIRGDVMVNGYFE